jgi:hypothetical protein
MEGGERVRPRARLRRCRSRVSAVTGKVRLRLRAGRSPIGASSRSAGLVASPDIASGVRSLVAGCSQIAPDLPFRTWALLDTSGRRRAVTAHSRPRIDHERPVGRGRQPDQVHRGLHVPPAAGWLSTTRRLRSRELWELGSRRGSRLPARAPGWRRRSAVAQLDLAVVGAHHPRAVRGALPRFPTFHAGRRSTCRLRSTTVTLMSRTRGVIPLSRRS